MKNVVYCFGTCLSRRCKLSHECSGNSSFLEFPKPNFFPSALLYALFYEPSQEYTPSHCFLVYLWFSGLKHQISVPF